MDINQFKSSVTLLNDYDSETIRIKYISRFINKKKNTIIIIFRKHFNILMENVIQDTYGIVSKNQNLLLKKELINI